MYIWPDCVPCMVKMSLDIARLSIKDERQLKFFLEQVLSLPPLRGEQWNITSPEIVHVIWTKMIGITGHPDPLRTVKAEQNEKALNLYAIAQDQVGTSKDRFVAALKFAIAGNSMDSMITLANPNGNRLSSPSTKDMPLTSEGAEALRGRLEKARTVVYLVDNCGEIVFDRLFLEVLTTEYRAEITAVVRSLPILNDATIQEANSVGLNRLVPVVENGIQIAYPGTRLALVSPAVRHLLLTSDLIISKGVGNLDSLTEEPSLKGKISYLFHGKCHPCCASRNVEPGTLIVENA